MNLDYDATRREFVGIIQLSDGDCREVRIPAAQILTAAAAFPEMTGRVMQAMPAPAAPSRFCSETVVINNAPHVCELYAGHTGDHRCEMHGVSWVGA